MINPLGKRQTMLLALTMLGAILLVSAGAADASRAPRKAERKAIRVAAMNYCQNHQEDPRNPGLYCVWKGGIRVSTVSRRYAWAEVGGPHHDSSGILKRVKGTRKWRMVRTMGGGDSLLRVLVPGDPTPGRPRPARGRLYRRRPDVQVPPLLRLQAAALRRTLTTPSHYDRLSTCGSRRRESVAFRGGGGNRPLPERLRCQRPVVCPS